MLGCRCRIGCSNCGVRASPSCSSITRVQTVGSAARPDVKTLSTRSSPCVDPKITRLNKVHDLKSISRSFGIGWTVMALVPFEAKLDAISADETAGVRWLDCDLRPPVLKQAAQLFKMDFQSERSPPR